MTTTTETRTITFAAVAALALHAPLHGGRFDGITTLKDGQYAAIALLPDKPGRRMTHAESVEWAESIGGVLMSRPVAAQCFAVDKDEFDEDWHWLSETCSWSSSGAWGCGFDYGNQDNLGKSYAGCARAVRLIHIID